MSLFIRTTHQAEVVLIQEVALESLELCCHLTFPSPRDLPDGDFRVVVTDPSGNSAEEFESPFVAFQKTLRTLTRKRLHVNCVRIRQRHHKQCDLHRLAIQHDIGEPVVDLGLTRTMTQRQEDFAATLLPLTHRFLHDRHTALVTMLLS